MNDYGRGSVLPEATLLPAAGAGLFLTDAHPVVLVAFFIIAVVTLVNLVGYFSRYIINKKG